MKDIDFDELDRAVNSIMATVPSSGQNDQTPEHVAAPVDRPAASSPQPAARLNPAPVIAAPASPVNSPQRPSMPAARRGGKFMDMVHAPASQKSSSQPSAPASREGLSITPRSRVELAPQQPLPQPTSPTSDSSSREASPEPNSEASVDIPEPVKAAQLSEVSQVPPVSYGPAESPFLSNAVVEKRPLNSAIAAGSVEAEPVTGADLSLPTESPASEFPLETSANTDQDEPPENPQMPELQSELVAIESNDVAESSTQPLGADGAESLTPPPKAAPLGAASIAQQYTTTPSTGDQSHAAIYDASDYPQPIAHPTKQHSSWWWVLWVIVLLAVGAGGAVLLYNVGIIP